MHERGGAGWFKPQCADDLELLLYQVADKGYVWVSYDCCPSRREKLLMTGCRMTIILCKNPASRPTVWTIGSLDWRMLTHLQALRAVLGSGQRRRRIRMSTTNHCSDDRLCRSPKRGRQRLYVRCYTAVGHHWRNHLEGNAPFCQH